jgi:nucleolar MIF4G domain-containing protein 1
LSRKDKRKAERVEKKTQKGRKPPPRPVPVRSQIARRPAREEAVSDDEEEVEVDWDNVTDEGTTPLPAPPIVKEKEVEVAKEKPLKSILKRRSQPEEASPPPPAKVSRAVKERIDQESAEIAALEKKLGVKGKKKSKGADDGLDDIFGNLGDIGSSEDEQAGKPPKRKRTEDDAWLASKRQKALGKAAPESSEEETDLEDFSTDESAAGLDDDDDDDDLLEDEEGSELDGFDSEDEEEDEDEGDIEQPVQPRVRENPYVAPVTSDSAQPTKYIPPALRGPPSSDAEALARLKRQVQGLLNRLSEANILSILKDIEHVYQNNPRGYVNTTLVDLLMGMLSDPSALLDTFLILHAGFIAAVYKVIGPDFGAMIVERIVAEFDQHYQGNKAGSGKQTTNLTSLVAELYTFQVIGSNLVFDYVRFFLDELTDINTELLLRIVRAAGPQLRQDDPTALKDIVVLLQKSVTKVGQNNLSVRTKFMIETINDLKNNKMKTGVAASTMSREHTTRMKKQLGALSTRNLKATEPLRISLKDIKDTDKKGKWWMVGASWRNDVVSEATTVDESRDTKPQQFDGFEDDVGGEVDLVQLAREQRMNTDVRRAIFISIMSASDFKDAQIRLNKLNLKRSQETEIPRVIVHCAGSEKTYNPYYTVLARKVCADHKNRKSFQFSLWDIFKSLGERQDGAEDSDDEEESATSESQSLRKLVNQGKLYGTLIGRKALPITSLKNLNFPYLQPKTKTFVEVLLVTTILESQKGSKDKRDNKALLEVFVEVDQAPEMIAGLQYFMKKVVVKTEIVEKGEKEIVAWGCKAVMNMLTRVLATTTMDED